MVEGYFTLGSESSFWLLIIFWVVLCWLFFFLVIARCFCRGLWDTAPTVGEPELWSGGVLFHRVRQKQVLERGKICLVFIL